MRLRIPRLIVAVVLGLGLLLAGAAVRELFEATPRIINAAFGLVVGLPLLPVGLSWLVVQVTADDDGLTARSLRGRREWTWADLRGIKLDQGEGRPRLSLHPKEGETFELPAWSLRASYDDGEIEPARPALERVCADHGIGFKSRGMLDPLPSSRRSSTMKSADDEA